jgi:uncharacterized protein (TIGR03382 family)
MKRLLVALGALSFVSSNSFAVISVNSETDSGGWSAVGGNYDYLADQQTGQAAGDIVGGTGGTYNSYDAGFFTNWDAGDSSNTDGVLGFRVRLDEAGQGNQFNRMLWVGMDANLDGSVDVFMGVNRQGSNNELGIYDAGTQANTSPSTTSVGSNATPYTISSSNYNYRAVNFTTDGGTSNDITTGTSGDPDYYLTFLINFQDVVNFLNTQGISINDSSSLRYVLATSTQSNSFNQDLGNLPKNFDGNQTWEQLGGFSPTMNATGQVIPEPSAALLGGLGLLALFRRRRN